MIAIAFNLGGLAMPIEAGYAEGAHSAFLRLVFDAEGQPIRSGGCLRLLEYSYPNSRWWLGPGAPETGMDGTLKRVLSAIRRKDRVELLRASDPLYAREPKRFDLQATAYFDQFTNIDVAAIRNSYRVDSLAIFFLELRDREKTAYAPLVFRKLSNGGFVFLLDRTKDIGFRLVKEWFDVNSGPDRSEGVAYCDVATVKKAAYRVPLDPLQGLQAEDRGYLYLAGYALLPDSNRGPFAQRVESTLQKLKAALVTYDGAAGLTSLLTPTGAKRLQEWFASADKGEREKYVASIIAQEPVLIFDLNPVFVAYMKSATDTCRVMYFLLEEHGDLVWVNSAYISAFDRLFKSGPLYAAASGLPASDGLKKFYVAP